MAKERAARGWGATVAGLVLFVVGLGLIVWVVITSSPVGVPLNNMTFAGIGAAGIGAAVLGVGLEKGAPKG